MVSYVNRVRIQQVEDTLYASNSWKRDGFGNWLRTIQLRDNETGSVLERQIRIKFKRILLRIETRAREGQPWVLIQHTYYRDIQVLPDGRVRLGRFTIGGKLK